MRPHLGHVERVQSVRSGRGRRHDLHPEGPARELAAVDRFVQVDLVRIGSLAGELGGLGGGEALDPLVGLEVVFDEELLAGGVDPLKGV